MLLPKKANQENNSSNNESLDLPIPQSSTPTFIPSSGVSSGSNNSGSFATSSSNSYAPVRQNNPPPQQIDASNFDAGETLVKNTNDSWINNKWRPAMGWMYMAVCIFDFILFPILWAIVQFWEVAPENDAFRQWQPLTLQGAGLFHMAMGAVLGISAYGRTKEKIESKN